MKWPLKCGYLLVFGLCLYLLDIGLHIGLAVKYLTMQGCHRSVSHTFTQFKLNDLVDLENLSFLTSQPSAQVAIEPVDSSGKMRPVT